MSEREARLEQSAECVRIARETAEEASIDFKQGAQAVIDALEKNHDKLLNQEDL